MTFSLKGLKTITNYQYEPACGILSLLDISSSQVRVCRVLKRREYVAKIPSFLVSLTQSLDPLLENESNSERFSVGFTASSL